MIKKMERRYERIEELKEEIKSLRENQTTKLVLERSEEGRKVGIRKNKRKYSVRDNRDRFFYPLEWTKFYDSLKEKQKIAFYLLLCTGARINEVRNIRVEDIDIDNKRLVLRVTKAKKSGKDRKSRPRIIPISTQLAAYLRQYIRKQKLGPMDNLNIKSTPATNIAMKKALQKAGIADWYMFSVHNIRKTLENWLLALGIDGLKVTAHIGHSLTVAATNYISADVFTSEEKSLMRQIIGDLYQVRY